MTEFNELMQLLSGNIILYAFLGFLLLSYLVVALLTWSFIKPLKYLGISCIVCGVLLFALKIGAQYLIEQEIQNQGEFVKTLEIVFGYGFATITRFSLWFVIGGIGALVSSLFLKKINIHDKDALITPENIKEL